MSPREPVDWWQWLRTAIGWDGALPLLAASTRAVLPLLIADKFVVGFISFGAVPLLAALVRAHRAKSQLEQQVGSASFWRQTLLAAAIVVLILFEVCCAALINDGGGDLTGWLVATALYFAYLVLVAAAVWPAKPTVACGADG